jgi:serine/threonine-protein phosphatase 2A regulatory subunit B
MAAEGGADGKKAAAAAAAAAGAGAGVGPGSADFPTKTLHMAWHPREDVLACAASNSLYIFNA